jgi:glycosyl transferase family 2
MATGRSRSVRRALGLSTPPNVRLGHVPYRTSPQPEHPEPLDDFRFYAIVKCWMEEDIIEATVRNLFTQGVDRVYLVDQSSTDATVERAVSAGATVAEVFDNDVFDQRLVQTLENAVVAKESLRSGADHVWWIYVDPDEFPEGPDGMSLRQYLLTLDFRFRIVGARFMNHLPDKKPEYVTGFHPIDFQPLCYQLEPWTNWNCEHWKHPLQRFDRNRPFLQSEVGAHNASGGGRKAEAEPPGGIVVHHFQYRAEEVTRARLERLDTKAQGPRGAPKPMGLGLFEDRLARLNAVYGRQWDQIQTDTKQAVGRIAPWPHVEAVRRWYAPSDLPDAALS